ncbi:histone-lysine N-methyltransferase%2C H3 lysine-79 specific-like [Xyrichtys novacula]|uniref:Histone-lysine N-methyltransferase, H3 lysine-79 specific-like n=1 Tax=Xyrichtys novacula TaxID=13765 RepID=A0AAV1H3J6_XYRNO|nr:histone-lysine N-methyltransferase%2C H3 lysine-79 specific-like [Xyrichtys novacula]
MQEDIGQVHANTLDLLAQREEEVKKLREELKKKDDLLIKVAKKEQDGVRDHETELDLLAQKVAKVNKLQEQLKGKGNLLETANKKEIDISQVYEDQLAQKNSKIIRLQEELKFMTELQHRVIKQRRMRTKAHIETLDLLNQKDLELKRTEDHWRSKYEDLQKRLCNKTNDLQVLQSSDI